MHRGACRRNRSYQEADYATTMRAIDKKSGDPRRASSKSIEIQGAGKRSQLRVLAKQNDWKLS